MNYKSKFVSDLHLILQIFFQCTVNINDVKRLYSMIFYVLPCCSLLCGYVDLLLQILSFCPCFIKLYPHYPLPSYFTRSTFEPRILTIEWLSLCLFDTYDFVHEYICFSTVVLSRFVTESIVAISLKYLLRSVILS